MIAATRLAGVNRDRRSAPHRGEQVLDHFVGGEDRGDPARATIEPRASQRYADFGATGFGAAAPFGPSLDAGAGVDDGEDPASEEPVDAGELFAASAPFDDTAGSFAGEPLASSFVPPGVAREDEDRLSVL